MPPHLHIDYETFSLSDLKEVGAFRYAYDPSTEILCAAMSLENEYPVIWYQGIREEILDSFAPYWDALENSEVLIYAHSAQFEMAISQALMEKTWGIKPPALNRWRCTANLARRAALPHKLETLSEVLGLVNQKDKKGKSLIKKFSVMQPARRASKKNPDGLPPFRIRPEDDPAAFGEFLDYCQKDVRAEQEVAKRLAYFDDPINNRNYSLDAVINARGVTVNVEGLKKAQQIIEEECPLQYADFRKLTGFNVTQGAKFKEWLAEQGVDLPNLQAATIEEYLGSTREDTPAVQALRMKQDTAYASVGKISTMLECVGPFDNRIRGMLTHHGATTGRWTNQLVQFQNMKRPTIKHSEEAYREICAGMSREMVDICYGPPLEVLSSCVRHFVHDISDGIDRPILDADYAAIEARIIAWLAGQETALKQYRAYDAATTKEEKHRLDPYRVMAAHIYGIPLEQVEKFPHRFVGKEAVLGCGYGMGAPKLRSTVLKKGYDMPLGLEDTAVKTYRKVNRAIVKLWDALDTAAKKAIIHKNEVFAAIPQRKKGEDLSTPLPKFQKIEFVHRDIEGLPFLLCKLPSGRKLAYPRPRVVPSRKFETGTSIVFFGHIKGVVWGEVDTFGGKLGENIDQAIAADIMAHGAANVEKAEYEIMTLVHDQALSRYHPEKGESAEEYTRLLTKLPLWAAGLPITAEGAVVPFYKKD